MSCVTLDDEIYTLKDGIVPCARAITDWTGRMSWLVKAVRGQQTPIEILAKSESADVRFVLRFHSCNLCSPNLVLIDVTNRLNFGVVEAFMTSGQAEIRRHSDHGAHWLATVASLSVGAAFFALWFWLLPPWLGFHVDADGAMRWRWIAAVPSVLGFAVALRCIWDFGWTGHGTPAPFAPPQKLVVVGFYRYVRNPMYVGFFVGWLGLWVVFGRANRAALTVALVAVAAIALFVRLYEEPILRKMFGESYKEYCNNVPRWIPRMRAWNRSMM